MQTVLFSRMDISDEVKHAIDDMGFEEATGIQSASIPLILSGRDVIGHSQTGTGKTAAFSIPVIEKIDDTRKKAVQVLILCPTRELVVQANEEIKKFTKYKPTIKSVPIYGGQQIDIQLTSLRQGPQIVIGTPGRIMDHMRRGSLKLNSVTMVVLDEADEMLSMGFREDIETILKGMPKARQTILFSATMSPEIMRITKQFQNNPELIKIAHEQLTVPSIEQLYYEVPMNKKVEVLSRLLDTYAPGRSMIFCNTKRMVDELVEQLLLRGYSSVGLHGDMKQSVRSRIMNSFKKGQIDILVATDVAARGIDVEDVEAVFNYDIPQDIEYYVHRIGRTGRAGKDGRSFTFVSGRRQIQDLNVIQDFIKTKIHLRPVPSMNEVMERKIILFKEMVKLTISQGNLEQYNSIVDGLLEDYSSLDIATALIKMLMIKDGADRFSQKSDDNDFAIRANHDDNDYGKKRSKDKSSFKKNVKDSRKMQPKTYNNENMQNISINIGKNQRVSANHILSAVAGASGLPGKSFGRINIFDDHTIVGIPNECVDMVINRMQGCKVMQIKTKTTKVK